MDFPTLKRPIHPMPDDVRDRLAADGLMEAYRARPPYQQNDYIGWIERAARPETRQKRIDRMIEELRDGHVYMGMKHAGRRP